MILLLTFLSLSFSGAFGDMACSYSKSREVRNKMAEISLHEYAAQQGFSYSSACPLNPGLDKLQYHEVHKMRRYENWMCDICDKQFSTETFLDNHFNRRHKDKIPQNATTCLADYCDIFNCKENRGVCNPTTMEKLKIQCEALASRCFPPHRIQAFGLHELFVSHVCGYLTCKPYQPNRPMDSITGRTSVWRILLWLLILFCIAMPLAYVCCYRNVDVIKLKPRDRAYDWKRVLAFRKQRTKGIPEIIQPPSTYLDHLWHELTSGILNMSNYPIYDRVSIDLICKLS
eukprot:Phypoly_transcript_10687.p1 GENE.Phypoly_transcript_10687~~Phypoly_transcript_10687.p1  ORF type:complete len:287 (+),score=0.74 Phypoly_transcript_10687:124-984(+)